MIEDNFPHMLSAVADHLIQHDLPRTVLSVRVNGSDIQVQSRSGCPIKSTTGVLAAWARSMTGVTVKGERVDNDSVFLYADGYLTDGTHAEVVAVLPKSDEGQRWWSLLGSALTPIEMTDLYELADKLEAPVEAVS